jgi:uncharacterized protein with PQ loop repeat
LGGFQFLAGAAASALAYVIYVSEPIRTELSIAPAEITLFMFILLVFAVFSMLSGMILIREKC